jgi:uncharacterized protein YigA (DUF484 family)
LHFQNEYLAGTLRLPIDSMHVSSLKEAAMERERRAKGMGSMTGMDQA